MIASAMGSIATQGFAGFGSGGSWASLLDGGVDGLLREVNRGVMIGGFAEEVAHDVPVVSCFHQHAIPFRDRM